MTKEPLLKINKYLTGSPNSPVERDLQSRSKRQVVKNRFSNAMINFNL